MAVTEKLITSSFNVAAAANFINSFANNDYFVYAARHIPYAGSDTIIPVPNNSIRDTDTNVYDNMIFAKRISSADVVHMAKKNLWQSNTHYAMYDHLDGDLETKNFFITVDDDTEYNVWKCLFNKSTDTINVNSTVAPSRVGSAADLNPVETGDGYVWKYMYTITKSQYEKFATSQYIPIIANTEVIEGATRGTIEVIKVEDAGAGYDNYIAEGTLLTSDITVEGFPTFYGAPATAVSIDDYYQGCVMKMTSGIAVGEYKRIVNYEGTASQKKFILDSAFINTPSAGDTYEVYPYAFVWGDGEESTPAEGIVYIDAASTNSISRVELLAVGENYRKAESYVSELPLSIPPSILEETFIQLPTVISTATYFSPASLRPIISPKNGHGSDPYNELFAKRVCLSAKFANSEGSIISTENDFRQVGVIKNPAFTKVDMNLTGVVGPGFSFGEKVYQYRKLKLHGNVSITSGSTTIQKTNFGTLSTTATIVNGGTGYNGNPATGNNLLIFDNSGTQPAGGTSATGTFANNGSGVITSVTITPGSGYALPPIVTVAPEAGGSNAVITVALTNPDAPTYKDAFETGDYVLVTNGSNNYISTVANVPQDYRITTANTLSSFTADNCEISAIVVEASGIVAYSGTNQIELSNVAGVFTSGSRIIGVGGMSGDTVIPVSGTTATITGTILINDRTASSFNYSRQLTQLVGTFGGGSTPFLEDEEIKQESLITYAQPRGRVHHLQEIDDGDDILWISNKSGIFNLGGIRDIAGTISSAELSPLLNKYNGDFVVGSGEVLYLENLDPIARNDNKSEIIKIVLEF
jgi:hypothetical protein